MNKQVVLEEKNSKNLGLNVNSDGDHNAMQESNQRRESEEADAKAQVENAVELKEDSLIPVLAPAIAQQEVGEAVEVKNVAQEDIALAETSSSSSSSSAAPAAVDIKTQNQADSILETSRDVNSWALVTIPEKAPKVIEELKAEAAIKVKYYQDALKRLNILRKKASEIEQSHKVALSDYTTSNEAIHSLKEELAEIKEAKITSGVFSSYTEKRKATDIAAKETEIAAKKQEILAKAGKLLIAAEEFNSGLGELHQSLKTFILIAEEAATAQNSAYPSWSWVSKQLYSSELPETISNEAKKADEELSILDTTGIKSAQSACKVAENIVSMCESSNKVLNQDAFDEKSIQVRQMISKLTAEQQKELSKLALPEGQLERLNLIEIWVRKLTENNFAEGVERMKLPAKNIAQTNIFHALKKLPMEVREEILNDAGRNSYNVRELIEKIYNYLDEAERHAVKLLPAPSSGTAYDDGLLNRIKEVIELVDVQDQEMLAAQKKEINEQAELALIEANKPGVLTTLARSASDKGKEVAQVAGEKLVVLASNGAAITSTAVKLAVNNPKVQKAALNASLSLVTASVSEVAPAAGAALNAVQPALKAAFDARIEGKNILAAAILNGNVETVSAMLAVSISQDEKAQEKIKSSVTNLVIQFRENLATGTNESLSAESIRESKAIAAQTLKIGIDALAAQYVNKDGKAGKVLGYFTELVAEFAVDGGEMAIQLGSGIVVAKIGGGAERPALGDKDALVQAQPTAIESKLAEFLSGMAAKSCYQVEQNLNNGASSLEAIKGVSKVASEAALEEMQKALMHGAVIAYEATGKSAVARLAIESVSAGISAAFAGKDAVGIAAKEFAVKATLIKVIAPLINTAHFLGLTDDNTTEALFNKIGAAAEDDLNSDESIKNISKHALLEAAEVVIPFLVSKRDIAKEKGEAVLEMMREFAKDAAPAEAAAAEPVPMIAAAVAVVNDDEDEFHDPQPDPYPQPDPFSLEGIEAAARAELSGAAAHHAYHA